MKRLFLTYAIYEKMPRVSRSITVYKLYIQNQSVIIIVSKFGRMLLLLTNLVNIYIM